MRFSENVLQPRREGSEDGNSILTSFAVLTRLRCTFTPHPFFSRGHHCPYPRTIETPLNEQDFDLSSRLSFPIIHIAAAYDRLINVVGAARRFPRAAKLISARRLLITMTKRVSWLISNISSPLVLFFFSRRPFW